MKNLTYTLLVCLLLAMLSSAQTGSGETASSETDSSAARKEAAVFRATKEQIIEAQALLKQNGSYSGETDGKFNDRFRDSIRDFQGKNDLRKTGTLDRATIEKLGIALTDKQKDYPVRPSSLDTPGNDKPIRRKAFRPTKQQITAAQTKLKNDGAFAGEINGRYGKEFRLAVREFQAANGLKRKGSLNRATLEKMEIGLTTEQRALPVNKDDFAAAKSGGKPGKRRGPVFRSTKAQIIQVQRMLKTEGLYAGSETGKLDAETRTAIREWQSQNNVKKTGTLNKETLLAMKVELTQRQKDM